MSVEAACVAEAGWRRVNPVDGSTHPVVLCVECSIIDGLCVVSGRTGRRFADIGVAGWAKGPEKVFAGGRLQLSGQGHQRDAVAQVGA